MEYSNVLIWHVLDIDNCFVQSVEDIETFCHFTKYRMILTVQVVDVGSKGYEKLPTEKKQTRSKDKAACT